MLDISAQSPLSIMKKVKLLVLLTLSFSIAFGQNDSLKLQEKIKRLEKNVQKLKKNNDSLEQQNALILGKQKDLFKSDSMLRAMDDESSEKIDSLGKIIAENKAVIDNTGDSLSTFLRTTALGAIILLIGILLEVLGATLIAASSLSEKIEPVRNARLQYTMGDIATGDKMKDNVMNFYGIIGSIILVFGFCLQFLYSKFNSELVRNYNSIT